VRAVRAHARIAFCWCDAWDTWWIGPVQLRLFQYDPKLSVPKYKTKSSLSPKISKLSRLADKFKWNNFTFGKKFKFPTEFELQNQEANPI
jgi:hypothetical protein